MANRLATSGDVTTYGHGMVVNDVIIDTVTTTAEVNLTAFATTFSGMRSGATVWLNGTTLGPLHKLYFGNGGSLITQASTTKMTITTIPGTQLILVQDASSNTGYVASMNDFKKLKFKWENDVYPGMRDGLGTHAVFQHNQHALKVWSGSGTGFYNPGTNANMFVLFGVQDGEYEIEGGEYMHGFAAIRINASNQDITIALLHIKRVYMHDTCTGEGFYIGMTSGTPVPKFKNVIIEDFLGVRTATEAVQLQHFLLGSQRTYIRNFVLWASGSDWLNPFGANQDNGIQFLPGDGNLWIKNFIVDGFGDNGIILNGSDQGSQKTLPVVVKNALWNEGRNTGLYINSNTTNGLIHEWVECFFRAFNNTYGEAGTARNFVISQNNGTETHKFRNCQWDGTKAALFQTAAGYEILNFTSTTIAAPVYMNSGFYETSENFEHWKATYTGGGAVAYKIGNIVANIENGQEYGFYKSKTNHNATATRPRLDTTNWDRLTWDTAGVRSDQVGWNSGTTQSNYPPDDFRLVVDNSWNKRRVGLLSNPQNTDYSQYQWKRATDSSGSGAIDIPGGQTRFYTPTSDDTGKYLALYVRKKTDAGYGSWQRSTWKLVS